MKLLDRLRGVPRRPDLESRDIHDYSAWVGPNSPWTSYADGSMGSSTGRAVNATSAINGTVGVYACVSLLSELIGSLPMHLFRQTDTGPKRIDTSMNDSTPGVGYPGTLARLLGEMPNPEMSAQTLWETTVGHGLLWEGAYINVVREGGRPTELWPLRPDRISLHRDKAGDLYYVYRVTDMPRTGDANPLDPPSLKPKVLLPGEVMRIPSFGLDGLKGLSRIVVGRNAISIEQAAQQTAGRVYANGAMPSAIVTIPKGPADKFASRANLYRTQMQQLYGGMDNAARMAVVEEGATWQSAMGNLEQMQFIATREFQIAEIARLYRIPPHMIGDVQRSTSWGKGIEEQSKAFLTYTLRPILSRIEAAVSMNLGLMPCERTLRDEGLYCEFITNDLLRADTAARYTALEIAIRNRIMTPAQAAAQENLPYDPDRPTDYTNPNTSAGSPAAFPDPNAMDPTSGVDGTGDAGLP